MQGLGLLGPRALGPSSPRATVTLRHTYVTVVAARAYCMSSLVPRPFPPPVTVCDQNWRRERPGNEATV